MRSVTIRFMLFMLACLFASTSGQQIAYAQQDDLSTIDDPLYGNYELYTVDDLVIQGPTVETTQSTIVNFLLETENNAISHQTTHHALTINCTVTDGPAQHTRIGRFFAIDRDVMVTLHPNVNASGPNCGDTANISNNMSFRIERVGEADFIGARVLMSTHKTAVVMADFTQDGLDDLFVFSDAQAFVATAANVEELASGFKTGPFLSIDATLATTHDMAAGDLNGDGFVDVAWIAANGNNLNFATVCPGPVAGTICAGAVALQVVLNPSAAQNTPIHLGNTANCVTGSNSRAIAVGDFSGVGKRSLVALYPVWQQPDCRMDAAWYEFNGDFSLVGGAPRATTTVNAGTTGGVPSWHADVFAQAAALNWFGNDEQLIVGYTASDFTNCSQFNQRYWETVAVITFSSNSMTVAKTRGKVSSCTTNGTLTNPHPSLPWLNGIAAGHFSTVPVNGLPNEAGFNLQIATLLNSSEVRIYTVNPPSNYAPSLVSDTALTVGAPIRTGTLMTNWLHPGDLQGRSMRLGAPTVVRVSNHSQPAVILGHPPMHADYILPAHITATEPEIVNFSVIPATYFARFTLSQGSENQSSTSETTSYSYGYAESVGEKFKVKAPLVASVSGSFEQAWEQTFERTSEQVATTQTSTEYNASATTGFGDQIWFMESGFNLYLYPVLGHTICPNEKPNCSDAEKQPLMVQFSGPNSTSVLAANGATTEWYQPVHQPGQIFSYPWNQAQLQARIPGDLEVLSKVGSFLTDDQVLEQEVSWSTNSETEQTTGTTHEHSFETSNSLSMGKMPKTGAGLKVTGSFDYNNSSAVETLNSATSALGSSTGIKIAMPGTFLAPPQYKYLVQGLVFGQAPVPGTVQNLALGKDIETAGALQTAFIADPTSPNAGSWWTSDASPYTQYVDLSLNHPARWSWEITTNAASAHNLGCRIAEGSQYNCVSIEEPDPTDIWNSAFYWMRGLLVTVGGTDGPQRNFATAGDDVYLRARVYNYSFKDIDPSHRIHVRFYRQRITGTTPTGDSVLIEEKVVAPLPGFNSQPDTPNWTTVTTSFDTTELGGQYFLFWVVVWLTDGNGNLVAELPAHGLTELPGALASIEDVPQEEVTFSGAEAATRSFSNNVGYLRAKFYVEPATAAAAAIQPGLPFTRELRIENVTASPQRVPVGERVIITAEVVSTGSELDGVSVRIFHLAPDSSERLLDHETLPYIPAAGADTVSIPFRPATPGLHEFVIVATRPGAVEGIGHTTLLVTPRIEQAMLYLPTIFGQ